MTEIIEIPTGQIVPSRFQSRKRFRGIDKLADSIEELGLIEPILVRPLDGRYELVAGERRWRATKIANLGKITAIVRHLSDSEARRIALEENMQRDDLSRMEEIDGWIRRFDAEMWHRSPAYRNHAEMNDWPDELDEKQAQLRARWLLSKLDSDRRHETDHYANKFIGIVEEIFAEHPHRITWQSFFINDVPLLDLPEPAKKVAVEKNLNKSQAKAMGKLAEDDSPEAEEVMETGRVTVKKGLNEFEEVGVEEASSREIEDAPHAKRLQDRINRYAELRAPDLTSLDTKRFRVLYADPPWYYAQQIEKYGPAERHYPTMKTKDICAMGEGVKGITTEDAVLFLWSTAPKLRDALEVAEAWGFRYTGAHFIWDKVKHNYGHYNSVRHELLLICVKGSCTPDTPKLMDSVQTIERTDEHSEKPERFREIIETLYTEGKRVELFARKELEGWETWGNEIPTQEIQSL